MKRIKSDHRPTWLLVAESPISRCFHHGALDATLALHAIEGPVAGQIFFVGAGVPRRRLEPGVAEQRRSKGQDGHPTEVEDPKRLSL